MNAIDPTAPTGRYRYEQGTLYPGESHARRTHRLVEPNGVRFVGVDLPEQPDVEARRHATLMADDVVAIRVNRTRLAVSGRDHLELVVECADESAVVIDLTMARNHAAPVLTLTDKADS
jgi:uncharacterized protein YkvS